MTVYRPSRALVAHVEDFARKYGSGAHRIESLLRAAQDDTHAHALGTIFALAPAHVSEAKIKRAALAVRADYVSRGAVIVPPR